MTNLQAARHALDRTLIFVDREGYSSGENVTLSATDFNALVACRDALDSLLDRPADYVGELVGEMEWKENHRGDFVCDTPLGRYQIWKHENKWLPRFGDGSMGQHPDSLEHGKALCRADFLGRIAGAFKSGKESNVTS